MRHEAGAAEQIYSVTFSWNLPEITTSKSYTNTINKRLLDKERNNQEEEATEKTWKKIKLKANITMKYSDPSVSEKQID